MKARKRECVKERERERKSNFIIFHEKGQLEVNLCGCSNITRAALPPAAAEKKKKGIESLTKKNLQFKI